MPIRVENDLPARAALESENIFMMGENRAETQRIRPLEIVILNLINRKEKNKLKKQIDELEKEKNLVISASMLSELNKVEALVNNDEMRAKLDDWKKRFNNIRRICKNI